MLSGTCPTLTADLSWVSTCRRSHAGGFCLSTGTDVSASGAKRLCTQVHHVCADPFPGHFPHHLLPDFLALQRHADSGSSSFSALQRPRCSPWRGLPDSEALTHPAACRQDLAGQQEPRRFGTDRHGKDGLVRDGCLLTLCRRPRRRLQSCVPGSFKVSRLPKGHAVLFFGFIAYLAEGHC